ARSARAQMGGWLATADGRVTAHRTLTGSPVPLSPSGKPELGAAHPTDVPLIPDELAPCAPAPKLAPSPREATWQHKRQLTGIWASDGTTWIGYASERSFS